MNTSSPATALVVTSIGSPNAALRELAAGCLASGWDFVVAGDSKSPADFAMDGCRFLSLDAQRDSGFGLGRLCPERSYTRKNLGYLAAIQAGARVIVETDDDNHPSAEFWMPRQAGVQCRAVECDGWVNAYQYFSRAFIYPRGLPLSHARDVGPAAGCLETLHSPIQQGLADNDPDVDAIYRMLFPLPFHFDGDAGPVYLRRGSWCPFNSQNTTFLAEVFPLLYLPASCSFRMTDIWRSLVAQRVLQANGLGILFHRPTVWQERNTHDLQQDFMEEIPGYASNVRMREALLGVSCDPHETLRLMMERCYEVLIRHGWVGQDEEPLLQAWLADLEALDVS
ncbi:MAG: STELLO glycosyltransferase family protein [Verrucomicrobiota bacterium]